MAEITTPPFSPARFAFSSGAAMNSGTGYVLRKGDMANHESSTTTPDKVKDLATTKARLAATMLIGVFGSSAHPAALLRETSGKINRIQIGDRAAGGRVMAIDATRVVIATGLATRTLTMPRA